MRRHLVTPVALSILTLFGCAADNSRSAGSEYDFSSDQATLLDFDFDGELSTDFSFDDKQTIEDQLLYTIGHLNADNSVGRIDKLTLTNIGKTTVGGKSTITYHAKLPVAWGSKTRLPSTYRLRLPRDVSSAGIAAFTEAHKRSCVDFGAHDVDTGSMWYYYRPNASGCAIEAQQLVEVTAKATRSTENTTGKYPEYHKVWEDNRLEVVAIFGKFEERATSGDAGIDAFNEYVGMMKRELLSITSTVSTTPSNLTASPGPGIGDVTFEATLGDGKVVKVTALLVDSITQVPPGFDARYESLTPTADLIAYNGHAGLGQNVRALARKGRWMAGKYQMFFMNGCDTFAYVDGSLAQTRAALNPDNPTGTKFMEFVTNAMPSFFSAMPSASSALMKGLLSFDKPKTYNQIFTNIANSEVVLVTGEEDNVFQPGMPIGTTTTTNTGTFKPFEQSGTVARNAEKASSLDVSSGTYDVVLSGDNDADLYVKKGAAATSTAFDCRPFVNGSQETCTVTFSEAGTLNIMVRGYASSSNYKVVATKR